MSPLTLQPLFSGCYLFDIHYEPFITVSIGPKKIFVDVLIDTGAQISVITNKTAEDLNIKPSHSKLMCIRITGVVKECLQQKTPCGSQVKRN